MELLTPKGVSKAEEVFATVFDFSKADIEIAKEQLLICLSGSGSKEQFARVDLVKGTARDLMVEWGRHLQRTV